MNIIMRGIGIGLVMTGGVLMVQALINKAYDQGWKHGYEAGFNLGEVNGRVQEMVREFEARRENSKDSRE